MFDLKDQAVIVVGAGMSGIASCYFLLDKGAFVALADSKKEESFSGTLTELKNRGVKLLLNDKLPEEINFRLAVKSPGVPPTTPLMRMISAAGIPVIGELELAYLYSKGDFVAITGTNGKTTTTALIGKIFADAGYPVIVGGNIGKPLIEMVEDFSGIIVAEVSSFQLEDSRSFAPKVGVFLNLTPDHLDRHGNLENYLAAKERIFINQDRDDIAVINYDDPALRDTAKKVKSKVIFFSRKEILNEGVYVKDGEIIIACRDKSINVMPTKDIYIKGAHNLENALASVSASHALGVDPHSIAESLRDFKGVEHRLERFYESGGVTYINDSKGTNPDSTTKALEAYGEPIILIAGGRNKGSDFGPLMGLIKEKVRFMVILGECKEDMEQAAKIAGFKNYFMATGFEEGVKRAIEEAKSGEIVMLSPACASWDMFKDYQERGRLFKEIVLAHDKEVIH